MEGAHQGIHIALAAEQIGTLWGIPITNTLITSWGVIAILLIIAFITRANLRLIPGKLQSFFEMAFEYVLAYMEELLEDKKLAKQLFPLIVTMFLFIFLSNVLEFLPGIGSIGFFHQIGGHIAGFTPLLRSVNTDLNVTIALGLIAFFTIEILGVITLGFLKYSSKFVNVSSALGFSVGIVELFSEVARLVSFSFRLFGNIFAGEVMLTVIAYFVPLIVPVPIMAFELFVGLMQAAIFSLLTLFFVKIAITEPH